MTATVETGDLTKQEQAAVRAALRFLRVRFGGWSPLAKVLKTRDTALSSIVGGHRAITARMVFKISRLSQVGIDDVLAGKFPPPGTCPHCGHRKEES